ncbi:MAG: hypothetical protein KA436_11490 [Oligoflexales bacterium]|nr:hypothetical protein [Oligoflexales bacterium]
MLTGLGKILILLGFMPTISCVTARNKPASEETKPPSGHKSNPANKGDSPNDVAHARFLEDLYKRIMKFTPKYADVDLAHHPIPPGDLLDIGGYKVYIHCTGEPGKSGKTVVINTQGCLI